MNYSQKCRLTVMYLDFSLVSYIETNHRNYCIESNSRGHDFANLLLVRLKLYNYSLNHSSN